MGHGPLDPPEKSPHRRKQILNPVPPFPPTHREAGEAGLDAVLLAGLEAVLAGADGGDDAEDVVVSVAGDAHRLAAHVALRRLALRLWDPCNTVWCWIVAHVSKEPDIHAGGRLLCKEQCIRRALCSILTQCLTRNRDNVAWCRSDTLLWNRTWPDDSENWPNVGPLGTQRPGTRSFSVVVTQRLLKSVLVSAPSGQTQVFSCTELA